MAGLAVAKCRRGPAEAVVRRRRHAVAVDTRVLAMAGETALAIPAALEPVSAAEEELRVAPRRHLLMTADAIRGRVARGTQGGLLAACVSVVGDPSRIVTRGTGRGGRVLVADGTCERGGAEAAVAVEAALHRRPMGRRIEPYRFGDVSVATGAGDVTQRVAPVAEAEVAGRGCGPRRRGRDRVAVGAVLLDRMAGRARGMVGPRCVSRGGVTRLARDPACRMVAMAEAGRVLAAAEWAHDAADRREGEPGQHGSRDPRAAQESPRPGW